MSIIGSGDFAQIYYPHLPCQDKRKEEWVGKVFYSHIPDYVESDFDPLHEEIKSLQVISRIDPLAIFSVGTQWEICSLLEFPGKQQIIQHYIHNSKGNISQLIRNKKKYLYSLHSLFYGITVLYSNQFIHSDINEKNIAYDEDGTLKFIDWGLSGSYEQVKKISLEEMEKYGEVQNLTPQMYRIFNSGLSLNEKIQLMLIEYDNAILANTLSNITLEPTQLITKMKQLKVFGGYGPIETWEEYLQICFQEEIVLPEKFINYHPKYRMEDIALYNKVYKNIYFNDL